MNLLTVDIGSFSLKMLFSKVEKKGIEVIDAVQIFRPEELSLQEGLEFALDQIASTIAERKFQGKIVMASPFFMTTSRYLALPVPSKKKAEMMIPFQLEDVLPFSPGEGHFMSKITVVDKTCNALVAIMNRKDMAEIYNQFKSRNIIPTLLTSEPLLIDGMVGALSPEKSLFERDKEQPLDTPFQGYFAVVDIGHSWTKTYFFYGNQLVANHVTQFGGHDIEKTIANNYQISLKEGRDFKHKSSFYLTDAEYSSHGQDQVTFARLMKEHTYPLIQELKRYILGHKVRYAEGPAQLFIMGGTSCIQNIDAFLQEQLAIPVKRLPFSLKSKLNMPKEKCPPAFDFCLSSALAQICKRPVPNFLKGEFSSSFSDVVSLHSTAFLLTRSIILCLILSFGLMLENILISKDYDALSSQLYALLKNPRLQLTSAEQTTYKSRPDRLLPVLSKKEKSIQQGIKLISSSSNVNAVIPLIKLSEVLSKNIYFDLITFENIKGQAKAVFKEKADIIASAETNKKIDQLKELTDKLESSKLRVLKKDVFGPIGKRTLSIEFDGK